MLEGVGIRDGACGVEITKTMPLQCDNLADRSLKMVSSGAFVSDGRPMTLPTTLPSSSWLFTSIGAVVVADWFRTIILLALDLGEIK